MHGVGSNSNMLGGHGLCLKATATCWEAIIIVDGAGCHSNMLGIHMDGFGGHANLLRGHMHWVGGHTNMVRGYM